jgi:hypothetical protein
MWPPSDSQCFTFVPQAGGLASERLLDQKGERPRHWSWSMLLTSRAVLQQHREVAAVLATYGMFVGGTLVLAWAIA